jgi:hypothetical protein
MFHYETDTWRSSRMTKGDCFEVALRLGLSLDEEANRTLPRALRDVKIVHGLPVGQGPENFGQRYWHAWIEAIVMDRGPWVYDYGSGRNIELKRAAYYRIGQLTDDFVWRFTPEQANALALKLGHYGPWVTDWEKMGL